MSEPVTAPLPSPREFIASLAAADYSQGVAALELSHLQAVAGQLVEADRAATIADWWGQLGRAVEAINEAATVLQDLTDNLMGQGLGGQEAIAYFKGLGLDAEDEVTDLYNAAYALDDLIEKVEGWVEAHLPEEEG